MIESGFPRGSEWRKWDLQVHTPFSALNNGFGQDFDEYAKQLLKVAVEKKIAAIGVTDYFSITGYRNLKELINDTDRLKALVGEEVAEKAKGILLLPNVELRASVLVNNSRVNFHVVFSDELDPAIIEEHFFRELKFTSQSSPGSADDRWLLTISNLESLGRRLKQEHAQFQGKGDLFIGMMNAVVSHEEVTEVLERQSSRFKDRYLIIVPVDEDLSDCDWNDQGHQTRKLFIQKSHMFFSASSKTRDFGLGLKHQTIEDYEAEFKTRKACVHGSDAHGFSALFEPDQNRYLWVKADPTFQGLRQLLNEPESRVYIGEIPPPLERVKQNATKFLNRIEFSKTDDSIQEQNWFLGEVCLNQGLVALIGNKGSGKSALADVLALLGDTRSHQDFSFLRKDRFLSPKGKLGKIFSAKLTWESGATNERFLEDAPDLTAPERIKYIPQNYLETICSELKESTDTRFDQELKDVIFSHVAEAERLGRNSLEELIDYKTSETEERILQVRRKLANLNEQIEIFEEQATAEHRKKIQAQIEQRKAELDAHIATKPLTIPKPELDPMAQAAASNASAKLADIQSKLDELESQLQAERAKDANETARLAATDRLLNRISNLERQFEIFLQDSVDDEDVLSIKLKDIVSISINREVIEVIRSQASANQQSARTSLDSFSENSLASQKDSLFSESQKCRSDLDEPNRIYQQYLENLRAWEGKRRIIEGASDVGDSLKGLEAQLSTLNEIPAKINQLESSRAALTREVFEAKEKLLGEYKKLYAPVQTFIDKHPISKAHGSLQFRASVVDEGLADGLLAMIHQGRTGTFYGEQEGLEQLKNMIAAADFTSADGAVGFAEQILDSLKYDRRDAANKPVKLKSQLKQRVKAKDVYDYLFSLEYLHPRFELRWQDKPLDQLSPGERGNLLLVFYLLIDQRDVPLLIDQPEENLDNQTIAKMLVPAIQSAKERRQIIMVTHNPNLAVVCDAEQIVHASINKTDGNRVTYTSGSIENPQINQLLLDILEGTKPAFDLRGAKYGIV